MKILTSTEFLKDRLELSFKKKPGKKKDILRILGF